MTGVCFADGWWRESIAMGDYWRMAAPAVLLFISLALCTSNKERLNDGLPIGPARTRQNLLAGTLRLLLEELDVTQETLAVACRGRYVNSVRQTVCTGAIVYESANCAPSLGLLGLNLPSEKRAGKKR